MITNDRKIIVLPPYSLQGGRGRCYTIRFRVAGKQVAVSSGKRSRREAEAVADGILAQWLAARGEVSPVPALPVQEEIEGFCDREYADNKEATKAEAVLILRRFFSVFGDLSLPEITREVFLGRAGEYRGLASPKYWVNILSVTRRFARSLKRRGKISEDFTDNVPRPGKASFGRRLDVWSDEEFNFVLSLVNDFDCDVLMTMRWCGMDSSDVAALREEHLTRDGLGNWIIKKQREKAKSQDETMILPLPPQVSDMLLRRLSLAGGGFLFGGGYKAGRSFTSSLLGRVRRSAGPTKDLKSLRHTFATHHAKRGVPMHILRIWMGHARDSRVLERIYVHLDSTASYMG